MRTVKQFWTAEENNNYDPPFALRYDPTPGGGKRNSDGTTTIMCTAPMLAATGWLAEPKQSLEKIATALNDYADLFTLRRIRDWHEDYGDALWWTNPVTEPPYVGSPLDCNWPGYHKWWTPLPSCKLIQGWFDSRRAAAREGKS